MKFTEEQLRLAAKRVDERLLANLPKEAECMNYTFSDSFERNMNALIEQVKNNEISSAKAAMGWQYYTRNGLVAILLCFLLSCIAMPEAVLAGYQKLVEVIETVVTEYTEYRYHSSENADTEFVPVSFGWLPEGMTEVERNVTERRMNIYFENESEYFDFSQKLLTEENGMTYLVDTENVYQETYYIGTEKIQLILKNGVYDYIWIHGKYLISGQTNLLSEEIIEILSSLC